MTKEEFINKWEESDWGKELISDLNEVIKNEFENFRIWMAENSWDYVDHDDIELFLKSRQ